eukprot:TRINITY_DN6131_c0_g1_i1.p1 TRINITY_DN6131_c0_g1~~TRINITY_DN6131_c0_g1_i1.p1  ORF type:complete len:913 (-),score=198.73 TRINITY_DN6131_c0_g1_i1:660-3254(-)
MSKGQQEMWMVTIEDATRQRMLTQKMAKEFFMWAKSDSFYKYKKYMYESIETFDSHLNWLMDGNSTAKILAPPTKLIFDAVKEVKKTWTPFKKLLKDNIDTVRKADGSRDMKIMEQVSKDSKYLLEKAYKVKKYYVDEAKTFGAPVPSLSVDIAVRQDMYVQKIVKESLLIACGVDVTNNLKLLAETTDLFETSHNGIILGVKWAGIPRLEKICTFEKMMQVTYRWNKFKPVIDMVLAKGSPAEATKEASNLIVNITSLRRPLFDAMQAAVVLYKKDDGACDLVSGVTTKQWNFLIYNMGRQRYLTQKCSELFMAIANGIDVAASTIQLQVELQTANYELRNLIEGSIKYDIPSPPTQKIADELLAIYGYFTDLRTAMLSSIQTDLDAVTVSRVASNSKALLVEQDKAVQYYVEQARKSDKTVPGYVVDVATRQFMTFQKMAKESLLVLYGADVGQNWKYLNKTRQEFKDAHWKLLLGDKSDPNKEVPKTKDLCTIQRMKYVYDHFAILDQACLDVANGQKDRAKAMMSELPLTYKAMDKVVGYLKKGKGECDPLKVKKEDWIGLLKEMGKLRMLSQKVAHLRLANRSAKAGRRLQVLSELTEAKDEFAASLRKLTYGDGAHKIPAPVTKANMDLWFALNTEWGMYSKALDGSDDAQVLKSSSDMLSQIKSAVTKYMAQIQAADATVPVARLDGTSRRSMLVHKMLKEAVAITTAKGSSSAELSQTIATFNSWHNALKNGGNGVPGINILREDLKAQWNKENGLWSSFSPLVLSLSTGSSLQFESNVQKLKKILAELDAQFTKSADMYAIADPTIPPAEEGPPWTLIIYISAAVALCLCVCTTLMMASRRYQTRSSGTKEVVAV